MFSKLTKLRKTHKKVLVFSAKTFFFALFFSVIFLLILTIYITHAESKFSDRIYPHVYVDGVDFSGKTKKEVQAYFKDKDSQLQNLTLTLSYREQQVTFSASVLNLHYDSDLIAAQAYSIGRGEPKIAKLYQRLGTIFGLEKFSFNSFISYDVAPVFDFLTTLESQYNTEPENALFKFENGRVSAFKVEKDGLTIKKQKTLADVEKFLNSIKKNKERNVVVEVKDETTKPEITLASTNNLGIEEVIGQGTSDYSGSIGSRIHNLILATSHINGALIPRGETFSFNKTVGDISADTGYQQAYIIQNGQTILGDGGGVCQVSTTLFRAILDAGLPIVERHAHTYRVHYYENDRKPGFDATVFAPSVDLRFKNNTSSAILIQTSVDKTHRTLTYTLYGKRDGRVSTVSNATVWDVTSPPEPMYQNDPTLKVGTTKQIDWAAPGTKSKFHYRVERDGEVLEDRDFLSIYRPWQAVYLVGTML